MGTLPQVFSLSEIDMLMQLSCIILGLALPIFFMALDARLHYVELNDKKGENDEVVDMSGSHEVPGTWEPDGNLIAARHNLTRHNVAELTTVYLAEIPGAGEGGYEYTPSEIANFVHLRRGDALELIRRIRL